jgi:mannose-6-phosphate isomerase-like protein (cupin superfamily)
VIPELLGPGEGDVTADRPERTTIIKAGIDELTVLWFRYEPGERGPDAHVHHEHSDCFYVLEGEVSFDLGDRTVPAGPGTFVLVPPDVSHSFRNDGSTTARFLNFHTPSCGFHDVLRARRDGSDEPPFDQFDPPAGGGRPASLAVVGPGGGVTGTISLFELGVAGEPASGFALAYWVLAGELVVRAAGRSLTAGAESFVLVPPQLAHTVEGPARVVAASA